MPRSNDDNSMEREGNSSLRVRQIQQENYYKTAIVSEAAFQKKLSDLRKSAERETLQLKIDNAKKDAALRRKCEQDLADWDKKAELDAFNYAEQLGIRLYKQKSLRERQLIQEQLAAQTKQAAEQKKATVEYLQTEQKKISSELSVLKRKKATTDSVEEQTKLEQQINELTEQKIKKEEQLKLRKQELSQLDKEAITARQQDLDLSQKLLAAEQLRFNAIKSRKSIDQQLAENSKEQSKTKDKIRSIKDELKSTDDPDKKSALREQLKEATTALQQLRETNEQLREVQSSSTEAVKKQHKDTQRSQSQRLQAAQDKLAYKQSDEYKEDKENEKKVKHTEELAERGTFGNALKQNADPAKLLGNALVNLTAKINAATAQIDQNINSMFQYQAQINARLNGTDSDYSDILKTIRRNIGINPLVSQKAMVENVKKLVDSGVTFDLEQRAFLATISDKIVNTFDAFDSNLLRVIRLQQADSTAARLGMESALNEFLNSNFNDSSYLNDAFDSVAGSLIDASAKLSRDQSVAFEYIVQKWLGSLYSLGLSSNTVSTIAQGLSYLGTGNVEALSGNESLQSLLAMSAARAGLSYSDLLTGGIDANNTNLLLKSMVEYLKEIAENSGNNVTAASYANVFGMNTTDLVAINNLQQSQINSLYKSTLSIEEANGQLQSEMNQVFSRTHVSQILETGLENLMTMASTGIGSNLLTYGTWKILNIVEDLTGGIAIPAISVFGNMVDLHTTVTQLAKAGMAGLSLMGSLIGGIGSLLSGGTSGALSWDTWKFDQYTSRGESINALKKGVKSGFSASSSMSSTGSASSSDIRSTTLAEGAASAEEDAKTTNASVEKEAGITENIYKAIADESGPTTLTELVAIHSLLDEKRLFKAELGGFDDLKDLLAPNRVFYSALIGMLPVTGESLSFINSGLQIKQTDSIKNYLSQNKTSSLVDIELNNLATKISQNQVSRISDLDSTIASYNATSKTSVATTSSTATTTNNPAQTLATAFRQALSAGSDDSESLMQLFKEIRDQLKDKVNVNITNDYVDEVLQRLGTNI